MHVPLPRTPNAKAAVNARRTTNWVTSSPEMYDLKFWRLDLEDQGAVRAGSSSQGLGASAPDFPQLLLDC